MTKASTSTKKPQLTALTLWIMTIATCFVVANIYYNQPLLVDISHTFHVSSGTAEDISTLTQFGYAVGMFFIVPMADMYKRKRLMLYAFVVEIVALLGVAAAPDIKILMFSSFLVGASSLIPQLLIPMAAHLANPEERGKKIGIVMGGLLIGILASRMISGTVGEYFGWRTMFYIAAGLMVVIGLMVFFFLPEVEPDYKGTYKSLMLSMVHLTWLKPNRDYALRH